MRVSTVMFVLLAGCRGIPEAPPVGKVDLGIWRVEVTEDDVWHRETDEATVFIDGHFVGNGGQELILPNGLHQLKVELEGHETFETELCVLQSVLSYRVDRWQQEPAVESRRSAQSVSVYLKRREP